MRNRKTKHQLVDDNEQAARIALYHPQLHAQKEKLEADLQELEHLALSGWGHADFNAGVNFAITEFSEDEMRRPTPYAVPLGSAKAIRALCC